MRAIFLASTLLWSSARAVERFLPECKNASIIVPVLQGAGYIAPGTPTNPTQATGNYTITANGIEVYGSNPFNSGVPSSGVFVRACAISCEEDTVNHDLFALRLGDVAWEELSLCSTFFLNKTNATTGSNGTYDIDLDYSLQFEGLPECKTDHNTLPNQLVVTDFVTTAFADFNCPNTSAVPVLLRQPFANSTETFLGDVVVHTKVGFSEGGWSVQYAGGSLEVTLCVVAVTSEPPELSGLYWADQLWQVVFGDLNSGTTTSCGWFARSGTNLTYQINLQAATACPSTLASSTAITVLNYWQEFNASSSETQTPSQSPTPSQTPTPSWSPRPSPVSHCWNGVLDAGETDVDCGGVCAPCVPGRACLYDIDCDGSLSNASGTALSPGSSFVQCNANTSLCIDLRDSSQAYNPAGGVAYPAVVQASFVASGLSSALLVPTLVRLMQANVTAALATLGVSLPAADRVTVLQAVGTTAVPPAVNLTLWLLLAPAADPAAAANAINANQATVAGAIATGLALASSAVSFVGAAAPASLLPPIPRTGPAPVTPKGGQGSVVLGLPAIIGIAAGGAVLLVAIALLVTCLSVRRRGGRCCGSTAFATCCGAWPLTGGGGKAAVAEDWVKSPVAVILPTTNQSAELAHSGLSVN